MIFLFAYFHSYFTVFFKYSAAISPKLPLLSHSSRTNGSETQVLLMDKKLGFYCAHNLGLLCTYIAGMALLGKSYVISSENARSRHGGVYLRSVNSLIFIDFW